MPPPQCYVYSCMNHHGIMASSLQGGSHSVHTAMHNTCSACDHLDEPDKKWQKGELYYTLQEYITFIYRVYIYMTIISLPMDVSI